MFQSPDEGEMGGSQPFMPDRADSVLGSYDYTDIIEEVMHRLRSDRIIIENGEKVWASAQDYAYPRRYHSLDLKKADVTKKALQEAFEKEKEKLLFLGAIKDSFQFSINSKGEAILSYRVKEHDYSPPLLNESGIQSIVSLITPYANRICALSSEDDIKKLMLFERQTMDSLYSMLFTRAEDYEIKDPMDMYPIEAAVLGPLHFGLQQPFKEGGRQFVAKIMSEVTRVENKYEGGMPPGGE